jgi:hypothetical protein
VILTECVRVYRTGQCVIVAECVRVHRTGQCVIVAECVCADEDICEAKTPPKESVAKGLIPPSPLRPGE